MQIGIFDSGLGGLALAQAIFRYLPDYDYLYLGDTRRVPYGGRSQAAIHEFVAEALQFLFLNNCQIVILACNTASAEALRRSQQEYLPNHYPERRVLGVIIPTVEVACAMPGVRSIGVLATQSTVDSDAYGREIRRQGSDVAVHYQPAPLLVPLVEHNGLKYSGAVLDDYLASLSGCDCLLLGCTHYSILKSLIRERASVPVVSQDEIIPAKLADYLRRHPEMESQLGRSGGRRYAVTDLTPNYAKMASALAGAEIPLEVVSL